MERRSFTKSIFFGTMALSIPRLWHFDNDEIDEPVTGFLKMEFNSNFPQFDYFSIDSLGKNNLGLNVILPDAVRGEKSWEVVRTPNHINYHPAGWDGKSKAGWEIKIKGRSFELISNNIQNKLPFLFNIEQHHNHATLLGLIDDESGQIKLPAILHLPDMGTLRVTSDQPDAGVKVVSQRFIEHPYVRLEFPPATSRPIKYRFEVVTIHPEVTGIKDKRFDCFRKNFISIFQINPFLKILANNTSSDACAFTLFKYATVAAQTPRLVNNLYANDLIRMTLDRYLAGTKGYGMLGYDYDKTWDIPETASTCNSLDSYPSLLMSACIYTLSSKDNKWFARSYNGIKAWADKMLSMDSDGDGLIEFCLSGNSGSWKGDKTQRPANWWDTIGFAHKDAYSNALAYRALLVFVESINKYGSKKDAVFYQEKARKLKEKYTSTFLNPATGIIAGWKSKDGQLHDYYFIFVNTVAISYGLIEESLANRIMDILLQKMKEVGYSNFELGLPGNLIPVIRADYTDLLLEVGGGKREDNRDGFQIYENGGATACFAYFTINALQVLGRKKEADMILHPLLKSMSEGNFQGRCANGRSKDWKTWDGECWGYEGFLVDNYMFLLCVGDSDSRFPK